MLQCTVSFWAPPSKHRLSSDLRISCGVGFILRERGRLSSRQRSSDSHDKWFLFLGPAVEIGRASVSHPELVSVVLVIVVADRHSQKHTWVGWLRGLDTDKRPCLGKQLNVDTVIKCQFLEESPVSAAGIELSLYTILMDGAATSGRVQSTDSVMCLQHQECLFAWFSLWGTSCSRRGIIQDVYTTVFGKIYAAYIETQLWMILSVNKHQCYQRVMKIYSTQ